MRPILGIGVLGGAVLAAGCVGGEKPSEKQGAPLTAETSAPGPGAKPSAPAAMDIGKEADAVLASWLAAQNDGKLDAYLALYDKSFKGVRRTGGGAEKSFDLDGWSKDRGRLFQKKQEVAAERVTKKVEGETVTLTFTQRWRSGKAADHGEKVIAMRAVEGKLRIVREELKWSERGWEDSSEKAFEALDLVSPITMTVEKVPKPDNGSDCSSSQLRIQLVDSKGTKKQFDHGTITGTRSDDAGKGGKLAPKNGEYTDLGAHCAGLQQGYTLTVSGEAIVALEIWNDEESGPGKDNKVIAKLPAGAQVVMK